MSFHSIRKTDVGLILSLLLIIGALWKGYAKPASWDEAVKNVEELKPKVNKLEKEIVELRAINVTQMSLILRELDGIEKQLKRK